MFESSLVAGSVGQIATALARVARPDTDDPGRDLTDDPVRDLTDAERIDLIRSLEELKAVAAAAQARLTDDFASSQRAEQETAGVRRDRLGLGLGAQVGLARRESPRRGSIALGLARVLVHEMPHTHTAMSQGWLSEWRATLLARETACLSLEDRRTVDRELAGDRQRLETLSDRQLVAEAKQLAYRLDPESVVARARKAETERHVTIRPAPDTMAWVTALLPVRQGVAVHAALKAAADAARAAGDDRSRGQVMADTLAARVTGLETADAVPVAVDLVMTDRALLRGDDEPAQIPGYGPVPAGWARDLVAGVLDRGVATWLRRLYTHPATGQLVAMDTRSRDFAAGLAELIRLRDAATCRNAFCGAPVRHIDHAESVARGGETSYPNGQGLCEACNYAKEAPGWSCRVLTDPTGRHTVATTTPTGHTYRSTAPPLPGADPGPRGRTAHVTRTVHPLPEFVDGASGEIYRDLQVLVA